MLSIGKLAPGAAAGDYYLERAAGCPAEYYLGRREAAGVWLGSGAEALGLHGRLDTPEAEQSLRRLLAGAAPDGAQLVKPVLRSDPRGRVPAAPVLHALRQQADERGVDVPDLLTGAPPGGSPAGAAAAGGGSGGAALVRAWEHTRAELERARGRPVWPAPTLPAETAQRMLHRAGLDPHAVLKEATPTGRVRDLLAKALRYREDRVDVRLPGLDLTLSAPKSVSLLWALSDPPTDPAADRSLASGAPLEQTVGRSSPQGAVGEQVRQAHRVAVGEALAYLELNCTSALRGHHRGDGTDTRVPTDGLIGAAFEHRSSRCGDPQLHTHVVVANLLHGVDGRWSAVNSHEIYTHARTAGFVYQAVLRGELTRRLGVTWTPVRNGQAEIIGLPPMLLRLFSKRRQQIEARLDQLGLDSPAAAQAATLDTRPAKPPAPDQRPGARTGQPDEQLGLQARWRQEAAAAGYDPHRLRGLLDEVLLRWDSAALRAAARATSAATGPVATRVVEALLAPTGLTERRAAFDRRDLLRGVCEQLPAGLPISLAGLRTLATRVLHDDRVIPLLGDAPVGARRYSTRELLALERDALTLAAASQPPIAPAARAAPAVPQNGEPVFAPAAVVPDEVLRQAERQAAARGCSAEQTAMLRRLLTSGAGVEVVVGAAGSGKTTALAVAADAWSSAGITVRGTALAAIAARVLQDSAGIPSRSLQRLLNDIGQPGQQPGQDPSLPSAALPPGGVLVVDEAGMVGTRTLHTLLTLAAQTQTKLVLVGDPRQLPEIDAGGLFATLAARLPSVTLLGNQRQQATWEQRALRELRDGDVVRALSAYAGHDRLRIEDGVGELTARLLEDYELQLTLRRPEQVLVIASSRGDARRLNAQLRQRLLEDGWLGPEELRVPLLEGRDGTAGGERGYRVGEQVLVTVNDYPLGLLNGSRGTVTTLHPDRQAVTVRLDDGRQLQLEKPYLARGHLQHGYALTAHKAQGVTVDVSLLWGTQALTRETGYVALSRGRRANYLYATWDLLKRDAGLDDRSDLDRPHPAQRLPGVVARRRLAQAALAQRLETSGQQRTARSWWRRRTPASPSAVERTRAARGR
jgi:conjugative relaxase-like TrwC/TraI family protein